MFEARERPIIFSGPSVIAIQQDRKTQTRRVAMPTSIFTNETRAKRCRPYGVPGDRLWVRESFLLRPGFESISKVHYRADGEQSGWTWKSPLFMFRRDSRILLEITDIRVQRVQEIRLSDCRAEGINWDGVEASGVLGLAETEAQRRYQSLWDTINAKRGYPWSANPWVWAITFKRIPMETLHGE